MKVKVIFYASLLMLCSCVKEKETAIMVKNGFERAEQQLSAQLQNIPEPTEYPRTINKQGTLKTTKRMIGQKGFIRVACGMYMSTISQKTGSGQQSSGLRRLSL